jgi:hypothetical protein
MAPLRKRLKVQGGASNGAVSGASLLNKVSALQTTAGEVDEDCAASSRLGLVEVIAEPVDALLRL